MFKEHIHNGITYTDDDFIQLLKLKNINLSNILCIGSFSIISVDYVFTISILYKIEDSFSNVFINICECDLIRYNRNNKIQELLGVTLHKAINK